MAPWLRTQVTAVTMAVSLGTTAFLGASAAPASTLSYAASPVTAPSESPARSEPPVRSEPAVRSESPTPSDVSVAAERPAAAAAETPRARLAGRQAGVGRERPGRTPGPAAEDVRPVVAQVPEAPHAARPPATSQPRPRPRTPEPAPAEPTRGVRPPTALREAAPHGGPLPFRALPLGAGIVLVGLGLGFLGMRLRRQ